MSKRAGVFLLAAAFLASPGFLSGSHATGCGDYRRGDMKTADLTVYANLDEYLLDYPPRVQRINYGYDYLSCIHIPGRPGFPFETQMRFRFEKDTGLPLGCPVGNPEQIEVMIEGTWVSVEERLPAAVFIPSPNNLTSIEWTAHRDSLTDMELITFKSGRGSNTEKWFDKKNEIYISKDREAIVSFMTCHKADAYRVPHCELWLNIPPLTVRVRFQRHLLTDLAKVREQAKRYVNCLMDGETRIPSTIPSDR